MSLTLKDYRKIADLKQDEMANQLGISTTLYCYIENGTRSLTREREKEIYKILEHKLKDKLPNLKFEDIFPIE